MLSPSEAGLSPTRKADLPRRLGDRFRGRRFICVEEPELLDHEGVEIVLIAASADISEELGIGLDADRETLASADLFRQLKLRRESHPAAPIEEGRWQ